MAADSENKRIAKNTFYLYTRMLLVMAISLYISRVVLQQVGIVDYGIYNVIGGFVGMFVAFTNCLSNAINRFFTYELGKGSRESINNVFSTSVTLNICLCLILFAAMEFIGTWAVENKLVIPIDRLEVARLVLQTSIITLFFNLQNSPFNAAIMAYEKMGVYAYLGIFDVVGKLIIALFLIFHDGDKLEIYAYMQMFFAIIYFVVISTYCTLKIDGCHYRWHLDVHLFSEMVKYASWMIFGQLSYVGITYGYNILLNIFFGPAVNAARGISVQVQNAIQQFSSNIQVSIRPQIIKNYASANIKRAEELVFAGPRYCFYLMLIVSLPIIIETPYLLDLWLDEVPDYAVCFTRFIVGFMCIDNLHFSLMVAIEAKGNIKIVQTVTAILSFLSIIVTYIVFLQGAPPYALYFVYGVMVVLVLLSRIFIVCRQVGLSSTEFYKKVIGNILKVVAVAIPIPVILYSSIEQTFTTFCLISVISIVSAALSSLLVGLSRAERLYVIEKVKQFVKSKIYK